MLDPSIAARLAIEDDPDLWDLPRIRFWPTPHNWPRILKKTFMPRWGVAVTGSDLTGGRSAGLHGLSGTTRPLQVSLFLHVTRIGMVHLLQMVRNRLGSWSHRATLPFASNSNPCSNNEASTGSSPYDLDPTISSAQGENCTTLRVQQEGRQLAIDGNIIPRKGIPG